MQSYDSEVAEDAAAWKELDASRGAADQEATVSPPSARQGASGEISGSSAGNDDMMVATKVTQAATLQDMKDCSNSIDPPGDPHTWDQAGAVEVGDHPRQGVHLGKDRKSFYWVGDCSASFNTHGPRTESLLTRCVSRWC
eukprot:COSAG05_NODE_2148_length_3476_cov_4.365709_2_plen_140_part_00